MKLRRHHRLRHRSRMAPLNPTPSRWALQDWRPPPATMATATQA